MLALRRAFPYFAGLVLLAALVWATSFGTLPPADFTFDNSTEIETIDPSQATGQPEHRIINALFEGLLRNMPPDNWEELVEPGKTVPMTPQPGMAELPGPPTNDGRTYTFRMRPNAKWSDGTPVTADDFAWSWMRTLHPESAGRYAYQLHYIEGARKYNLAQVEVGDRVEIEIADRPDPLQLFPRGTILRGILTAIHKPPEPKISEKASAEERGDLEADWKERWAYVVEVKEEQDGQLDWDAPGTARCFARKPAEAGAAIGKENLPELKIEPSLHVLPDFATTVKVAAESPERLVVTLENRTPYFLDLVTFYPTYPVQRACIEQHGSPDWTKAENLVGNGPFTLEFRRIRDRIRLRKNPHYWDAANVHLDSIDALATKSETTGLNMYFNEQIDWATVMPMNTIPKLKREYPEQFFSAPELTVYFYRLNVTRPELSDKRVRQALALAINKAAICEQITRAGEAPAGTLVPPGIAGYTSPPGSQYNVERAKALLAEAGYPGGRGLPPIEILYNDMDAHRTIAEAIQQMWKRDLGIRTQLRGLEWGVYLDTTHNLGYDVSRAGWVADYPDPNTFLDMFMTGNENNQTGWSNAKYDELIRQAAREVDPATRMNLFTQAEAILLDEQPIIPIYFRVTKNLVQPHIRGFFNSVQDEHPLHLLRVER